MVRLEITLYQRLPDRQILVEHTENQYFATKSQGLQQVMQFSLLSIRAEGVRTHATGLPSNHWAWGTDRQALVIVMHE